MSWSNLRPATVAQNNANRSVKNNSKSGFKGVWWNKQNSKWISFIVANANANILEASTILPKQVLPITPQVENYSENSRSSPKPPNFIS